MSAKKILVIILVVIVIGAVAIGSSVKGIYNSLVNFDEDTKTAWAQVETVLQRRFDLIPNLVATVKGFAQQEQDVFVKVAEARASVGRAQNQSTGEQIRANNMLSSALGRLMVVVERYPEIKSNQNFMRLQDDLAGTENRIAVARRRYNDVVGIYNKKMRSFPTVFLAGAFGFTEKERFEADTEAENAPKVDFK